MLKGFCALIAVDNIGTARQIAVAPNGGVYVAIPSRGASGRGIIALRDTKGDDHFDMKENFGDGCGTGVRLLQRISVRRVDRPPGALENDPRTTQSPPVQWRLLYAV